MGTRIWFLFGYLTVCAGLALAPATPARAGAIVGWGNDFFGQVTNAPTGNDFIAIAGGSSTGYALRSDGAIAAWGYDGHSQVTNAPTGNDFIAIAGSGFTTVALRSDGTIAAWGDDSNGMVTNAPTGNDFIAITAGYNSGFALRSDRPTPAVPEPSALLSGGLAVVIVGGLVWRRRAGAR